MTVAPVADPANNMGVSNLIWEIRRERRVELMYDKNDRYWSLIRWHQLDKLDSQKYPDIFKGAWVGTLKADAKVDENGYIDVARVTTAHASTMPRTILSLSLQVSQILTLSSSLTTTVGTSNNSPQS